MVDYYLTNHYFKNWDHVSDSDKNFWILKQKEKQWDYVFLGSSRVAHSIVPELFQNSKCINIGANGTSHADHYLFLNEFYKNSNKIDTLFLQVDEYSLSALEDNTYPFKDFVFALKFRDSVINSVYKDCAYDKYIYWQIPLIRYIEFSNFYKIKPYKSNYTSSYDKLLGYSDAESKWNQLKPYKVKHVCRINELDIEYLKKVVQITKEKKTELILFTTPIHIKAENNSINREESYAFLKSFSKKNNINYYNFSHLTSYNDTFHFSDGIHLSPYGAKKFTTKLIDEIN